MKKLLLIPSLILISLSAAAKKPADNTRTTGYRYLEENATVYDALQKEVFAYSEPGYQEYKSSRAIANHLEANGFSVEMGVADIPTAFVATYGSGRPVIGLLGEYDALVGMSQTAEPRPHPATEGAAGHACGHNLLGTAPAAAAVAISKWLAEGHSGTIKYFGCPAEEGGGGKSYMVASGCFKDCDAVLDWHPADENNVKLWTGLANVRVVFTFHGQSAHAGSAPWEGRSALDGVESFNYLMNLMREHVTPDTRIHYAITGGGQAPNVVPNFAQVCYYIRSSKGTNLIPLLDRAVKAAEGAALGTGTTMSYEVINGSYERFINEALSEVYLKNLKKVGGTVLDEDEKEYCRQIFKNSGKEPDDLSNFTRISEGLGKREAKGASSDAGNVSQVVPMATLRYAAFPKASSLHSWQVAASAGSGIGTKVLLNVARIQYLTALDLFGDPALIGRIKDEYSATRGADFEYKQLQGDRKPPFDYCK